MAGTSQARKPRQRLPRSRLRLKGSGRSPESPRRCRKVKAKAKKEADQRVANVANQLTEERTKTKDLAEELRKAQEQANDLAKRLALYEDPTKGTDHNGGGKFKK